MEAGWKLGGGPGRGQAEAMLRVCGGRVEAGWS